MSHYPWIGKLSVWDTEGNKHIYILDKFFDCIQPHQHFLPKDNETNFIVYKFKNYFSENKFSLIEKI